MTFELLQRDIKTYIKGLLRLLLVKSPGQSHVATSSYYQHRLIDKRMYPSVWSQNCLFPPIGKVTTMRFLSMQSTHKNSILHYKAVKVTINIPNFAKVIVNVIVCLQVVTNSGALYSLETCNCCAIFWMLGVAILSHSICKPVPYCKAK